VPVSKAEEWNLLFQRDRWVFKLSRVFSLSLAKSFHGFLVTTIPRGLQHALVCCEDDIPVLNDATIG
jgi:hypothetical protein